MTLTEAAKKWNLSLNWVRELVRSQRVKSKLNTSGPVAFYEIDDNHPKPPSMQRAPYRKGSPKKVTAEAIKRREARATPKRAKPAKVAKASKTSKTKS